MVLDETTTEPTPEAESAEATNENAGDSGSSGTPTEENPATADEAKAPEPEPTPEAESAEATNENAGDSGSSGTPTEENPATADEAKAPEPEPTPEYSGGASLSIDFRSDERIGGRLSEAGSAAAKCQLADGVEWSHVQRLLEAGHAGGRNVSAPEGSDESAAESDRRVEVFVRRRVSFLGRVWEAEQKLAAIHLAEGLNLTQARQLVELGKCQLREA